MLWGQKIKVYTDHQNLIREALGLSSNRVYCWRLVLEEYGPEIVYIRGIHNTVADAISRLDFNPDIKHNHLHIIYNCDIAYNHLRWQAFSKCLTDCESNCDTVEKDTFANCYINAFANHSKEEEIFPLTIYEIADAQ